MAPVPGGHPLAHLGNLRASQRGVMGPDPAQEGSDPEPSRPQSRLPPCTSLEGSRRPPEGSGGICMLWLRTLGPRLQAPSAGGCESVAGPSEERTSLSPVCHANGPAPVTWFWILWGHHPFEPGPKEEVGFCTP